MDTLTRRTAVIGLVGATAALALPTAALAAVGSPTPIVTSQRLAALLADAVRDYCREGRLTHLRYVDWHSAVGPQAAWKEIAAHPLFRLYAAQARTWSRASVKVGLIVRLIERRADPATALGMVLRAKALLWNIHAWEDGGGRLMPEGEHWKALDQLQRAL